MAANTAHYSNGLIEHQRASKPLSSQLRYGKTSSRQRRHDGQQPGHCPFTMVRRAACKKRKRQEISPNVKCVYSTQSASLISGAVRDSSGASSAVVARDVPAHSCKTGLDTHRRQGRRLFRIKALFLSPTDVARLMTRALRSPRQLRWRWKHSPVAAAKYQGSSPSAVMCIA